MAYSSRQKHAVYQQAKSELQTKLIETYEKTLLQVPVIPLPGSPNCHFNDIYVRPTITREINGKRGMTEDIEVISMSEIFTKGKDRQRYIYLIGEAGTGKSFFCRKLIMFWCMAHSETQCVEDELDGIKEMKKFDFLFYIPLRRFQQVISIEDMLLKEYNAGILRHLIDEESGKLLILLDGLDEWFPHTQTYNQFQTEGLPQVDCFKDYTVITTSRPWKIRTLVVCKSDMDITLKLKINEKHEQELLYRTLSVLSQNSTGPCKDVSAFEQKLDKKPLAGLKQVPLILQHLICLWLNDDLNRSTRCSVYTSILELFFIWNDSKSTGNGEQRMEDDSPPVDLPQYLADKKICKLNSDLIYDLSRMAYETLFRPTKDNSWTFYDDVLLDLDLYEDDVKERCVVLGILSEDTCPIFWAHKPSRSLFSFIHKSMHEFMAAVCIAVNYKNKLSLLNNLENVDLKSESMQFVEDVFRKRSTLDDILEVSNVFIFLCGLEPRLATHVWKCIYDICFKDPCVQGYRRAVENDDRCIVDLQDLIFNSVEECNASVVGSQPRFYLGDLIINSRNFDMVCSSIDRQQIALESVLSLTLSIDDCITTRNGDIFRYLPMFQHLEKISIKSGLVALQLCTPSTPDNEQSLHVVNSSVAEMMKVNVSTLKSLSVCGAPFTTMFYPVCTTVLYYLPSMINLEAIKMSHLTLNHEHASSFCEFLQGTSHLEGIYLCLSCECGNQHDINLSNHHQLKYINYISDVSVTNLDASNLEVFRFSGLKYDNYMNVFGLIGTASKLTELDLFAEFTNSELFHSGVTGKLCTVLPLLHNLNRLHLTQCRLHDNIIQLPLEMKSLKHISLYGVIMNLRTWRKFVDILPDVPHTVSVSTVNLYIAAEGEEITLDINFTVVKSRKKIDAIQYLYKQKKLFKVVRDDMAWLSFSTKKIKKKDKHRQ